MKKNLLLWVSILIFGFVIGYDTDYMLRYSERKSAEAKEIVKAKAVIEKSSPIADTMVSEVSAKLASCAERSYTVTTKQDRRQGLWGVAKRMYGDSTFNYRIAQSNLDKYPSLGKNPDLIMPGWVLRIPCKEDLLAFTSIGKKADKKKVNARRNLPVVHDQMTLEENDAINAEIAAMKKAEADKAEKAKNEIKQEPEIKADENKTQIPPEPVVSEIPLVTEMQPAENKPAEQPMKEVQLQAPGHLQAEVPKITEEKEKPVSVEKINSETEEKLTSENIPEAEVKKAVMKKPITLKKVLLAPTMLVRWPYKNPRKTLYGTLLFLSFAPVPYVPIVSAPTGIILVLTEKKILPKSKVKVELEGVP
jgi:hypothetical protein